jgi:FdhD protein
MIAASVSPIEIHRLEGTQCDLRPDLLAVEEPLEIRLLHGPKSDRKEQALSLTMRTPGHDLELVSGLLFAEGIIDQPSDLLNLWHCEQSQAEARGNVVKASLHPARVVPPALLARSFAATASCGICGKNSLESVQTHFSTALSTGPRISATLIQGLPAQLRQAQLNFAHTGGMHAAALFDAQGELLLLREDIGRHNALDKLIGACFAQNWLPLHDKLIFLSGRIGFELVQKALRAACPVLAAVGAPSSLAVQLAQQQGQSLLGFVRNQRCNVYSGFDRIVFPPHSPTT